MKDEGWRKRKDRTIRHADVGISLIRAYPLAPLVCIRATVLSRLGECVAAVEMA